MSRRALAAILVLAATLPARADVSPYASWRVVTEGRVEGAVQAGSTVYIGGSFTKIGRAVAAFEGFLDPSTLALTGDPGCARDQGVLLGPQGDGSPRLVSSDYRPFGTRLRDGVGPFLVADDVAYVRVGADCRFDRRFAIRLPQGVLLQGRAVQLGEMLYAGVWVITREMHLVAAFDATTGDVVRAWPVASTTEMIGLAPEGRLAVASRVSAYQVTLGHLDTVTGSLVPAATVDGVLWQAAPFGAQALVSWATGTGSAYVTHFELRDLATWAVLPAWPDVRASGAIDLVATAFGGRVFLAARGLQVNGDAPRALRAFDAGAGSEIPGWSAPAWLDGTTSTVASIAPLGSRLAVIGSFAPGAPRDTLAALDATTGALDPWAFGYTAGTLRPAGPAVYVGRIVSAAREPRRYLAAVDAATGDLLPWNPAALLPADALSAAMSIAYDGGFVYVGSAGGVRRYAAGSGARDESWRLDVARNDGSGGSVWRIAVGAGVVYATGVFDLAKGSGDPALQPRTGVAAMAMSGTLTGWRPPLGGTCYGYSGRIGYTYACVEQMLVAQDRVFLRGNVLAVDGVALRSVVAVSADTGDLDPAFPAVPSYVGSAIAADGDVAFVQVQLADGTVSRSRIARIEPGLRIALLPADVGYSSHLAARAGRVYGDVERDDLTGTATGNATRWIAPVAAPGGLLDIRGPDYSPDAGWWTMSGLAWFPDIAPTAPGSPTSLAVSTSGAEVTLNWARADTDLQPSVAPPAPGATAATSHVVTASPTPGGPTIAQLDTASSDTEYTVTAPSGVFFVRVQARNAFGTSAPSNEVRVEVRPSAPDAPVATLATVVGSAVRIQWQAAPAGWPATGFLLEAGTQPGATDIGVLPVSGLEFRVTGVPPGRYYVRVRGVNSWGAGAPGEEVLVIVQ